MTQHIQLTDQVYAVEVPEGTENIRISQLIGMPKLFADMPDILWAVKLPLGNWQLICTTKEITKELAYGIIDRHGEGWKDYDEDNFHHDLPFPDPLDSLRSLLTSKGLDPNKNYVLIKKLPL